MFQLMGDEMRKFVLTTFLACSGFLSLAAPALTQEKHLDGGILGEMLTLLSSINTKLDKLNTTPTSPEVNVTVTGPRAGVVVPLGNARQCTGGGEAGCHANAAILCKRWGYPKGEATIVHLGSPQSSMSAIICFD
jgi:hypothetical protein